ncbi:hypothetical protein [Desulfofalx alkaliphila]|uniref:hypothetical protein n=1 Tax=Desulfofalx alkaliphila TaxID=105483 RepID=UPI0004E152CF|nr:hypothetical protein [Desulfofalx alkaliphila]
MSDTLRYRVFKELVQDNTIEVKLDRRKAIDKYNERLKNDVIKGTQFDILLYLLSGLAGFGLFAGLVYMYFKDPWWQGLVIALVSIAARVIIWLHQKNRVYRYIRKDIMSSEEAMVELYQGNVFTLKNKITGKEAGHPKKWTLVLPERHEVEEE